MGCPLIYTFTSFGCNEDCTRVYACPSFLCSNVCIFNVQFNYVAKHNEDDEGNDDDNSIGNGLITAYNLIVASSFSTIQKIYKHFSVDLNFKFSVFMNHLSNIYLNYDMLRVSNIPEPLEFSTQSYPNCTQYGRWYLSQYQIFQIFYNWFIDSNSKQMKEKKVRRLRSTYVRLYMWPEQKRQSTKMDYLKHVQLTEMNRIASHQSRVPSATNVLYLQLEWWMMTSSTCQKISCLSAYTHTHTDEVHFTTCWLCVRQHCPLSAFSSYGHQFIPLSFTCHILCMLVWHSYSLSLFLFLSFYLFHVRMCANRILNSNVNCVLPTKLKMVK